MTKSRSFLVLIIFLFTNYFVFSQGAIIQVTLNVSGEINDSKAVPLESAIAEIFMDGELYYSAFSNTSGKFSLINLPVRHTYLIYFKKSGYVSKVAEINANFIVPEALNDIVPFQMQSKLFKVNESIDLSFLGTTPAIKVFFDDLGNLTWDIFILRKC